MGLLLLIILIGLSIYLIIHCRKRKKSLPQGYIDSIEELKCKNELNQHFEISYQNEFRKRFIS